MKPWLTPAEAATLVGRSKRTIRMWVLNGRTATNPVLTIREKRAGGNVALNAEDIQRVCRFKDAYRDAPTFGRA